MCFNVESKKEAKKGAKCLITRVLNTAVVSRDIVDVHMRSHCSCSLMECVCVCVCSQWENA